MTEEDLLRLGKAGLRPDARGQIASTLVSRNLDIRSFEGMRLQAATVLRRGQHPADLQAPTVLVVGSSIETAGRGPAMESEAIESLIPRLTRALAQEALNLVTCSAPGIPDQISRSYAAQSGRGFILDLVVTEHPESEDSFGAYAPHGFRCHGDISVYCGMPFEMLACLAAQVCDVVVVVSGGLGSVIETSITAMRECPVITLVETGGAAEMIAPMLSRFKASNRGLDVREVRTIADFERELGLVVAAFRAAQTTTNLAPICAELHSAFAIGETC